MVPDLLLVDPAIEFVVPAHVDDALFRQEDRPRRQKPVKLPLQVLLLQVDPELGHEPVEDEAAVDDEVLVRPRRHYGFGARCGGAYLMIVGRSILKPSAKRLLTFSSMASLMY